jgi:hypothetical protein
LAAGVLEVDAVVVAAAEMWNPASPRNRDRTRESQRQVRRLLLAWDPIGVAGVPEAADAYDCMISPLLHRLFDGADAGSLAAWISHERVEHLASTRTTSTTSNSPTRSQPGGRPDRDRRLNRTRPPSIRQVPAVSRRPTAELRHSHTAAKSDACRA